MAELLAAPSVIPAEAGIQGFHGVARDALGSRLRGNDATSLDAIVTRGMAHLTAYQDAQRALSLAWHRSLEGREVDVLVEGPSAHDEGVVCGRTGSFAMVNFPGDPALVGQTVRVRCTRGFTHSVRGERV